MIIYKQLIITLFCLLLFACASTKIDKMGGNFSSEQLGKDEKQLWADAEKIEIAMTEQLSEYDFKSLEMYLSGVVKKITSGELKEQDMQPRIRVIPDITVNAFIFPNGAMYITTGLLSIVENESQLAFVIGHELSHYFLRHSLREMRAHKNSIKRGAVFGVFLATLAGSLTGTYDGAISNSASNLWSLSADSHYSRDLEREADKHGLRYIVDKEYNLNEGIQFLQNMDKALKVAGFQGAGKFSSHPEIQERIENYKIQLSEVSSEKHDRELGKNAYYTEIFSVIKTNTELNIQSGRPDVARETLTTYVNNIGEKTGLWYLFGEVHRLAGEHTEALFAYKKATQAQPSVAVAFELPPIR